VFPVQPRAHDDDGPGLPGCGFDFSFLADSEDFPAYFDENFRFHLCL
jgi:hypothetical protein